MRFFSRKKKTDSLPWDAYIFYENGEKGELHFFAADIHDALKTANYWLPKFRPVSKLLLNCRLPKSEIKV